MLSMTNSARRETTFTFLLIPVSYTCLNVILAGTLGSLITNENERLLLQAKSMIGMLTSTSIGIVTLTFSLTVLSIQIAAQTYSPRLLDDFLKDPISKIAIAINLGAYSYGFSLTYFLQDPIQVPYVAIHFLSVQMAAVLLMFVVFIHYFINGFRLESILHRATEASWVAAQQLEQQNGLTGVREFDDLPCVPSTAYKVLADNSGYLSKYKLDFILPEARALDICIRYHSNIGEFVAQGTLLAYVWDAKTPPNNENKNWFTESKSDVSNIDISDGNEAPPRRPSLKARILAMDQFQFTPQKGGHQQQQAEPRQEALAEKRLGMLISKGLEISTVRSGELDVLLGVQQLTDVAVRALSAGVNDPMTAVQALDYLSSLFGRLCHLDFYVNVVRDIDANDRIRCSAPRRSFTYLLSIVDAIRFYGGTDLTVNYRLIRFYADLGGTLTRLHKLDRIPVVLAQLEQCMIVCRKNFEPNTMELKSLEELYQYSLSLIASSDRPILEHGESIERDLNDLETTFVAPTRAFVRSLPKEYQGVAQLSSVISKPVNDDGPEQQEKEDTKIRDPETTTSIWQQALHILPSIAKEEPHKDSQRDDKPP
jgi:uncharacterized membrane protein